MKKPIVLASSIALSLSAGFLGSIFTTPSIPTWYASLVKPSFNPPNWLFAPVWTMLYLLMGISFYLILISKNTKQKPLAIKLYLIQLILNTFWSIIFFGAHALDIALIEIIILWVMIVATIYQFQKIEKNSAWLLLPYLLWVSFASLLNFSLWQLNL